MHADRHQSDDDRTEFAASAEGPPLLFPVPGQMAPLPPNPPIKQPTSGSAFVTQGRTPNSRERIGRRRLAVAGIALCAVGTTIAVATFALMQKPSSEPNSLEHIALGPAAVPNAPRPPAATDFPGLLAYWNFDEGQGNKAADISGKWNHGTLHGPKWVPGVRGMALHFDGPPDYVEYGKGHALNFAAEQPLTFTGWVRTSTAEATILSQRNEQDGGSNLDVNITSGSLEVVVRQDGGELGTLARARSKAPINDRDWHHFALTRTLGGQIDMYIDGAWQASDKSANAAGPITSNLRALGSERYWVMRRFQSPERCYFRGDLDEICIFGRALQEKEIKKLAGR
jgi:Concanavalin A-like lectin/glucanases superfamily